MIGTLATQAAARGMRTVISTGDKDLAQLVDERTVLVNTMTRDGVPPALMDAAGVREKFGVDPGQIIDFLSLTGDAVDNVPGVDKVGPKTAAKWLNQYGTLDEIMARADEVGGKVGENLRAALGWLPKGRELVTVLRDADLSQWVASLTPCNWGPRTMRACCSFLNAGSCAPLRAGWPSGSGPMARVLRQRVQAWWLVACRQAVVMVARWRRKAPAAVLAWPGRALPVSRRMAVPAPRRLRLPGVLPVRGRPVPALRARVLRAEATRCWPCMRWPAPARWPCARQSRPVACRWCR